MSKRQKTKEEEDFLINLGNKLRELREVHSKSYENFAYENNIPRAQYGRYEKGQDMTLTSLRRVLKALNVSFEEFFKEIK